ncbi:MAG: cell division protein FtsB [Steroidobacteraceae bacterium]
MKWLAIALGFAVLALQYRLWMSEDGVRELMRLRAAVEIQTGENAQLTERNHQLGAEVRDLKQGFNALEERARSELGMIAGNETFYQVVPEAQPKRQSAPAAAGSPTRTAQR